MHDYTYQSNKRNDEHQLLLERFQDQGEVSNRLGCSFIGKTKVGLANHVGLKHGPQECLHCQHPINLMSYIYWYSKYIYTSFNNLPQDIALCAYMI